MFDLGLASSFSTLPAPVDIGPRRWYLVREGEEYRLLSSVCPHQGGTVVPTATAFECPNHGWRFDLQSGNCLTGPAARLESLPVVVRDGRLLTTVTPGAAVHAARRRESRPAPSELSIRLRGHACLEIEHRGFRLLTDPWLNGPAFLGAWIGYPGTDVDASTLAADALWISHEHSDHFHTPTLAQLPRGIPVYFPDFPNGRLVRELAALGFRNLHPMQFGVAYEIGPHQRLTCYEPPGLWNDSVVLMELDDFRLLNINDAGVNHRIASAVGHVDVLASTYCPATSYPYAWSHLTEDAKTVIIDRARLGMLRMLHHAVREYQPEYLLPFASHFALWHPSHREYMKQYRRNTLEDVQRGFARSPVQVIGMLPGGSWEPSTGSLDPGPDGRGLYDMDRLGRWLDERFDARTFERYHPQPGPLHRDDVEQYVMRLNEVPDVAFSEDLTVNLQGTDDGETRIDLSFDITAGRVTPLPRRPAEPNLEMQVPIGVLRHIVQHNASWDEAHIGFWCRFKRTPDVYHAGFWRLLQAPYYLRTPMGQVPDGDPGLAITLNSPIADVIERYGPRAERVLGRYGLHCASCPHAPAESVMLAAHRHGVDQAITARLLHELNAVARDQSELVT